MPAGHVHFWEYHSHDAAGQPVDVSRRLPGSRQLAQPADAELIANYSTPSFVLGHDWNPKLRLPAFAAELPAAAASPAGSPVLRLAPQEPDLRSSAPIPLFAVVAAGDCALQYQWSKNGTALPGESAATLRFRGLRWEDAANYTVTVSDAAGSVTSPAAQLTAVALAAATPPRLPAIPAGVFSAADNGAVADGVIDNTAAIQKTIAAALAAGGGTVEIPAGAKPYLCGPLTLGSKLNFQIDVGATLQLLPYAAGTAPAIPAYPGGDGERYANLLTAANAHDVAVVTGGGTIDGQKSGADWWHAFVTNHDMPHRPFLVVFNRCNNVLVSGITLLNSPMFHVATNGTNHLTAFGITISALVSPNTDGVDPGGSHIMIQNCHIAVGDDNVVLKPGGTFCSDITVADCYFGIGHGMSVGGQSNAGLDGMTVKNIYFNGTVSGLRLKADSTQGGPLQNVTYTNLVMENVEYPIVFYSYYRNVGSPGTVSGSLQSTPDKVKKWNATPPDSLSRRIPAVLEAHHDQRPDGAADHGVQHHLGAASRRLFLRGCEAEQRVHLGRPGAWRSMTRPTCSSPATPRWASSPPPMPWRSSASRGAKMAPIGTGVTFSVTTAGTSGVNEATPHYQWTFNGAPLADGPKPDGAIIAGAATATLQLDKIQAGEAGKYAVTVSNSLDGYDVAAKALAPGSVGISATSAVATLNQAPPNRFGP